MPIPDHLVEEIRQRADIVEIVSEHTRLKRTGKTYRGPCPLHGGEGPNFSVDPAKGFYKCFTCGEGGSVYTFLQKKLGMTYPDAIRAVAARLGIEIPDPREEQQEEDPNRVLYEVNHYAADWFRKQLAGDDGKRAREYLAGRGITDEVAARFGLGWAPEGFEAFGSAARRAGFHTADLLAVGLVKEPKKLGREPYDAFRGRIIFPIEDLGGRVLAFGGRVLGPVEEHVPKYLNSPESPIYHKGRTLYGLGWSRGAIRKDEVALVVEGYMDYVSIAAHGFANAVAPLGTAMTEEQAALIRQYAPRAILLYDSDKAGLKATFRNGDQLLRAGMEVLVATLPEGEDPDSLVRAQGEKVLRRYLDDAIDVLERKLQILDRRDFFGSIKGTRRAIDYLLPTVRAASDPVLRGVYLKRVSDRTGVGVETLEREVAQQDAAAAPMREAERRREWDRREEQRVQKRASPAQRLRMGAEKNLLMMMFQSEHWIEEAMKFIGPDDFEDADYRRLFRVLIDTEGGRDAEGRWLLEFPEELNADVEVIRQNAEHHDWTGAPAYFAENMDYILARPVERRFRGMKHRQLHGPEDEARMLAEMQEMIALKRAGQAKGAKPGILDPAEPFGSGLRRGR